jgi:hypothetical protein
MRYAIILSLFLCSCNRRLEHKPVVDINPAFQGLVDEFVAESQHQSRPISITDLVIRFTNELTGETLGECFNYHGQQTNMILIDVQDWPNESDEYRRIVLFHELGHCILNLEHDQTGRVQGGYCTPTSIMWPYVINETNMYVENWGTYMVDLFAGTANGTPCAFNNYWGGN